MSLEKARIEELFHMVADLTVDARERFFHENYVDPEARKEVEDLLAFDTAPDSLDFDISRIAERVLTGLDTPSANCGPYRLGELLGRGGMGAVYAAERVDGELAQRAAVKLLRPGADDPVSRQRFLSERQILADLSHPNVARLLHAGHREDGQPYLVMEYVEGKPIDEFAQHLSVRQKIELFLKVCEAVSYLHRNLVVHRDLKPSNILVAPDGEPKLLDFGIAKILDLAADSTATCMRMLTPGYASPEQVIGGPITTATDVYSLGAVLYKLLTGSHPHQAHSGTAAGMATAIARGKIASPSDLRPELKGDVEFILLKALRTEPEQRYATVDQLSDDLDGYLASRPIRARKGNTWYRARKLLRRHWLPATAIILAVFSLVGGLLVANYERSVAQRRYLQVRRLANKLFDIDTEVKALPGSTKARELIVNTSLQYLRGLEEEVHGDPDVSLELGNAYLRVARVQGVPTSTNLGHTAEAARNLETARRFVDFTLKAEPGNRTALLRAAQIAHDQMILTRNDRHEEEALALAKRSAGFLSRFKAGPADVAEAPGILVTYVNVSDQFMLAEEYADALTLCRQGIDIAGQLNRPNSVGSLSIVMADIYRRTGDLDAALREIRQAETILDKDSGKPDQGRVMNLVQALINEGQILAEESDINLHRPQEALAPLERAFQIADTAVHQDARDQNSRRRLAVAGLVLGRVVRNTAPARSLELYDHVRNHMEEIGGNTQFRRGEAEAFAGSAEALLRLHRYAEAHDRIEQAFDRLKQLHLYPAEALNPSLEVHQTLQAEAAYQAAAGNFPRALELNREILTLAMASKPKTQTSLSDAYQLSLIYSGLENSARAAKQPAEAARYAGMRTALWRPWLPKLPRNTWSDGLR